MKRSTICFCINGNNILLGMKKRGFGEGKWNGFGGKVHEDETPRDAAIRELTEESGLVAQPQNLREVGLIQFFFEDQAIFECTVFLLHTWEHTPEESNEMRPEWFAINKLPYNEMWPADQQWIPLILEGKNIEGKVIFNHNGSKVKEFSYHERVSSERKEPFQNRKKS